MNLLPLTPKQKTFYLGAIILVVGVATCFFTHITRDYRLVFATPSSYKARSAPKFANQTEREFSGNSKGKVIEKLVNELGMSFVLFEKQEIAFGIHEVTRAQFKTFAEETKLKSKQWDEPITPAKLKLDGTHPVVNITWHEANAFCTWLSERDNRTYRLPTDYEWSIAAGMDPEVGHQSPSLRSEKAQEAYFLGKTWSSIRPLENCADVSHVLVTGKSDCFPFDDGFSATAPVGRFTANAFGIHDMGGNVSEWVYDWFLGRDEFKTVRGSSYCSGVENQKIHYKGFRSKNAPTFRNESLGFRVVVEIPNDDPVLSEPAIEMTEAPTSSSIPKPQIAPVKELVVSAMKETSNDAQFNYINDTGQASSLPEENSSTTRKKVRVTYTGKDGVNIRKDKTFSSKTVLGSLHAQSRIPLQQLGSDTKVDTETWVQIEVTGWIPTRNSTHTYLKDQGDGTWRVVWSKPGDRYVSMRSGTSSDDTLISKVSYNTIVERLDAKMVGKRHYIYAKYTGWAVKRNRKRSYFTDL